MNIKEKLRSWLTNKNPLAVHRRNCMRNRLKNTTPTFFCPNCIGGILFHDLGLQFRSPTVNLMMTQTDFAKFITNAEEYLKKDFQFFKHTEYDCPCARLGDVTVHFTHYKTEQEALEKWKTRAERIDWENVFVFLTERDGLTENEIRALADIHVRGLVVFTANKYADIPYTVHISKYEPEGEVGNILKQSYFNGRREYEKYFDFVRWFNEASGDNYDVRRFAK